MLHELKVQNTCYSQILNMYYNQVLEMLQSLADLAFWTLVDVS